MRASMTSLDRHFQFHMRKIDRKYRSNVLSDKGRPAESNFHQEFHVNPTMKRRSAAQPLGKLQQDETQDPENAASSSQQSRRSQPRASSRKKGTKHEVDDGTDIVMTDDKAEETKHIARPTVAAGNASTNNDSSVTASAGPITLARTRIRVHPDPSRPCYINDLVAVELESCMHFLDTTELLRFARTQKKIHSVASSHAAWRHQPEFELQFKRGFYQGVRNVLPSLLKHSPTGIKFEAELGPSQPDDTLEVEESDITEMLQIPYIKIADISGQLLSEPHWRRIISGLATNQVSQLRLTFGRRGMDITEQMHRLKFLTRLQINFTPSEEDDEDEAVGEKEVKSLHHIPNLTSLDLIDVRADAPQRSCTYSIEKCAHLTELKIANPQLSGARFVEFFTSPHLSKLESVYIVDEWYGGKGQKKAPTRAEYAATFSAMPSLRLLVLDWQDQVPGLISGLAEVNVGSSDSPFILRLVIQYDLSKSCIKSIHDLLSKKNSRHALIQLRGVSRHQVKRAFTEEELAHITSRFYFDDRALMRKEDGKDDVDEDKEEDQDEEEEEQEPEAEEVEEEDA